MKTELQLGEPPQTEMTQTRLVPWFGCNTANAGKPAELLQGCRFVYIPFAGSMTEVRHFPASTQVMVSDLHDELITLAKIVADGHSCNLLAMALAKKLFHPKELEDAKDVLADVRQASGVGSLFGPRGKRPPDLAVAEAYFTVAWMGRSAMSGTQDEERVSLSLRYDAGGGDSSKRFFGAVDSLAAWHLALSRCSFTREDAFDVLSRLEEKTGAPDFNRHIGVYADPPWPDDGDRYLHMFSERQQRDLAKRLGALNARVIMRFGDHPLIRELYPEKLWVWHLVDGRDQDRKAKAEVFLERRWEGRA